MGLIPDETIAEIRSRADIVSVIGQHVQLKRAGRNWKGLCPFHGEKSPSFNVSPDKGFFYCFGCHKKGDAFTFVMELQGKSFLEAAETLAALCGVVIPETTSNPEIARARGERSSMLAVNKLATQFFAETLASPRGAAGRAYLDAREIKPELRATFLLGFAPADWHGLADFLNDKRTDPEIALKLGLIARQPKAGGYYDRFRERVVCPIVLPGSEIAGFSARLVADAPKDSPVGAKYINSPESAVYKKSRLLFGLAQARDSMRIKGRAVLVEGNFDVISMHQAGFTETVAPLGTALTPEQVELLRRSASEVILFYDGDRAGKNATRAALELLLTADVAVRIAWRSRGDGVRLEGQDPDSLLRAGVDVGSMLDTARDGLEHYAFELVSSGSDSGDSRARALEDIARLAARIPGETKREVVVAKIASKIGVETGVIMRALGRAARANAAPRGPYGQQSGSYGQPSSGPYGQPSSGPFADDPGGRSGTGSGPPGSPDPGAPPAPSRTGPVPEHELDLLALVADHPALLATPQANKAFSLLTDERLRDMYSAARAGASLALLAPDRLPASASRTILEGRYASLNPEKTLDQILAGLHVHHKARRLDAAKRELKAALDRGDRETAQRISLELLNISKQVD